MDLPVTVTNNNNLYQQQRRRRGNSWIRAQEKYIHVIPVLCLLSFFILWWFSYPVHVVIKDGRITEIYHVEELPEAINKNGVDITILASSSANAAATNALNSSVADNPTMSVVGKELDVAAQPLSQDSESDADVESGGLISRIDGTDIQSVIGDNGAQEHLETKDGNDLMNG